MVKQAVERVPVASADIVGEQIERLRAIFPEAFSEGKIDFEKLKATLGEFVDERAERYSFSWAGKQAAIRALQTPTWGTLKPDRAASMNFDSTQNLFIEGENLEVLKLLYKSYFGRVKMIYIDPPYNTGNDFVYPDDFRNPKAAYLRMTGQVDEEGNLLTSNPETSGRYHSDWLSMMYPRLFLARQLLRDDGVIFVSIDDHEVHNLRLLMNEVFGEENFIECFVWKKSYGGGAKEKYAVTQHEYVLLYAKSLDLMHELWLPPDPEAEAKYYKYQDEKYDTRGPYRLKPLEATRSMDRRENLIYPIPLPEGGEVWPARQWWWSKERAYNALRNNELVFHERDGNVSVSYKQYLKDEEGEQRGAKPFSVVDGIYTQHGTADINAIFGEPPVFPFPKPVDLMKLLVHTGTESDTQHIVLDFFAGSAPLAQATLELNAEERGNRRFVMVQLPEPTEEDSRARILGFSTIAEIAKERIRRVISGLGEDGVEDWAVGFRAFILAESNWRQWQEMPADTSPEEYVKALELFHDPLVGDWRAGDLIYEVMLREGFSLTSRVEPVEGLPGGVNVWRVTDGDKEQSFLICLDARFELETARLLDLDQDDLFICRDIALDDTEAANLALQCRLKII